MKVPDAGAGRAKKCEAVYQTVPEGRVGGHQTPQLVKRAVLKRLIPVVSGSLARIDDQLGVFGYEDICLQIDIKISAGILNRFGQQAAGSLNLQELVTSIAREGEFVRMAWLVVILSVKVFTTHSYLLISVDDRRH